MRLIPSLAAMLLISATAFDQPAPDAAAPDQSAPPPPAGPGMQGGMMMQGPSGHHNMAQRFAAANTSSDGKLTLDQAKAAHWGGLVKNFDAIDADHKGYVTIQDIRAWRQASHGHASAPPAQ